jgi:hypothetical protein
MTNPQEKITFTDQMRRTYGEYANKFEFGSNPSAELWNGRLAMLGFLGAMIVELTTGKGFFHWLGLF